MMNPDEILDFYNSLKEMHKDFDDQIDQPSSITTRLKSYQLKAVKWMVDREKNNNLLKNDLSAFRGGILADDIGLGKTLEMLCVIVANRAPPEFRTIFPTPKIKNCIPYLTKDILDHEPVHDKTQLSTEMRNHMSQNKTDIIKFVYGQDGSLNFLNCYCSLEHDEQLITVVCALCDEAQHMECVNYKPKPFQDNIYLCPSCWYLSEKIDCKATLIIVPLPIMDQWIDEVEKHGLNVLKVHIYKGVHSGEYIEPLAFCDYDIVITTYSFLEDDLSPKSTSFPNSTKQFERLPNSPLFCLNWWRICLDYDRSYLCDSTIETILKLNCVNQWIITGTPIQSHLNDLEWPLKLLNVKRYCMGNDPNTIPSQEIDLQRQWFSYVMWRNSATDVDSEVVLQKSSIEYNWLTFSQIEKYFYTIQQECAANEFTKLVCKAKQDIEAMESASKYNMSDKILIPMMILRHACLHPLNQFGQCTKLIKTMPMKNVIDRFIKKSSNDCNNKLTLIISGHTQIAGLYVKNKQISSAINEYKIILDLIQKHEDQNLEVDACQKMHTMYNLDVLLNKIKLNDEDIYASFGLKNLKNEMELHEKDHLDFYKNNVNMVFNKVQLSSDEISALTGNKTLLFSEWWPEISLIVTTTLDEFLGRAESKWKEYCSTGVADIGNSFSSISSIDVQLKIWCKDLQAVKDDVLKTLNLIQDTSIDKLAQEGVYCHLDLPKESQLTKFECTICKAKNTLDLYKRLLFSFPINQDNFDELLKSKKNDEEEWKMSLNAFVLTVLLEFIQAKDKNVYENAVMYLKIVELLRKQFIFILQLWSCVKDYISAYFEINIKAKSASFDDTDDSESFPSTNDEKCEKIVVNLNINLVEPKSLIDSLERDYAIFRYLNNFKKEEANSNVNEQCEICTLENDSIWAVLRCGHKICKPCLLTLLKSFDYSIIICPICRDHALAHTLCFAKAESEEPSITLKGTFSTKIECITLKLLKLIIQDPTVKVLIFSIWEDQLELIGKALKENSINHRILKLGNEYKNTLKAFKANTEINALLLTMSLGSKGLNLTEATRIFFTEPIIEDTDVFEATGRINRIGQTKPTFVHHFIMKDSIEEIITNEFPDVGKLRKITFPRMLNLLNIECKKLKK